MMAGHRFNPENAKGLLDPKRTALIDSNWVAKKLYVPKQAAVMDLGAGTGFFTLPLALSTSGTVYAVDIEAKMLKLLKERAAQEGIHNIQFVEADLVNLPLSENSVAGVVAGFVLHEVDGRDKVFADLRRIMQPGARGAVVEWALTPGQSGPPLNERLAPSVLMEEMRKSGLAVTELIEKDEVYVVIFESGKQ